MNALHISQAGIDLIKHFEGLRLEAYKDPIGVWTIGYGHTATAQPGQQITEADAEALLRNDLAWAEDAVRRHVTVPLTQGQYDALVSFTYNLGESALAKSTLLRKLNAGDSTGAAAEFGRWVHADGRKLAGLVRRRAAEQNRFVAEKKSPRPAS